MQQVGLLERAFGAKGISVHWPDNTDDLLAAIKLIKSQGPVTAAQNALRATSDALVSAGVKLQFIACSEFSLIADCAAPDANIVDTIHLLAQEIVGFSKSG